MILKIINDLIVREGGYVNNPNDKGGPTKYGITAQTLGEYRKLDRDATADEVKALTTEEAAQIYRDIYLARPKFDQIIDPKTQEFAFDCAVNSGVVRAARWIQAAMHVDVDGKMGPATLAAVNRAGPAALPLILAWRIRFLGEVVRNNPSQATFIAGWLDRCADFLDGGN